MSDALSALRGAVYDWTEAKTSCAAAEVFRVWREVPADLRPVAADYLAPHLACGPQTAAWRVALLAPESPYWVCARGAAIERGEYSTPPFGLLTGWRPKRMELRSALHCVWAAASHRMPTHGYDEVTDGDFWGEGIYHINWQYEVQFDTDGPLSIRPAREAPGHLASGGLLPEIAADLRVANEVSAGWVCASLRNATTTHPWLAGYQSAFWAFAILIEEGA